MPFVIIDHGYYRELLVLYLGSIIQFFRSQIVIVWHLGLNIFRWRLAQIESIVSVSDRLGFMTFLTGGILVSRLKMLFIYISLIEVAVSLGGDILAVV